MGKTILQKTVVKYKTQLLDRLLLRSALAILLTFTLTFLFTSSLSAQKKSYDGQGAVSEIVMASPAEIVSHFDLFFKSKVEANAPDKHIYWYKIIFNKECSIDFTLFPLFESDRYGFEMFKVQNSVNFCEAKANQAISPVNNMQIKRTYKDNEQSETFRSNLITTRRVPVKAGETVFIVVKSIQGQDHGHVIGLNTCDYSYVLEVDKTVSQTDTSDRPMTVKAELNQEEALEAIGHKLCPPDGSPVKLGTLDFNKKVEVSNQLYEKGEAKANTQKRVIPTDLTARTDWESKPLSAEKIRTPRMDSSARTAEIKPGHTAEISPTARNGGYEKNPGIPEPKIWLKDYKSQNHLAQVRLNEQNLAEQKIKEQKASESKKAAENKKKESLAKSIPVRCLVTDAVKEKPIDNPPVILDELTGKVVPVKKLNPGEYEFSIEKGKSYKIECSAMGYRSFDHSLNIYKALSGEENELELKLQPLVAGENFILKNIYFHANTPVIKNESGKELEKLYTFMKDNADAVISIEGHTNSNRHINRDSRREQLGGKWAFHGTAKKLSKSRADEVCEYLTKKGVDPDRIRTKGWGGDHELYPNAKTLEESSKNMRVEVVILKI